MAVNTWGDFATTVNAANISAGVQVQNAEPLRAAIRQEAAAQGLTYSALLSRLENVWKRVAAGSRSPLLDHVIWLDLHGGMIGTMTQPNTSTPAELQAALQAALQATPPSVLALAPQVQTQVPTAAQQMAVISAAQQGVGTPPETSTSSVISRIPTWGWVALGAVGMLLVGKLLRHRK